MVTRRVDRATSASWHGQTPTRTLEEHVYATTSSWHKIVAQTPKTAPGANTAISSAAVPSFARIPCVASHFGLLWRAVAVAGATGVSVGETGFEPATARPPAGHRI